MSDYDFAQLNDKEFEVMSTELLSSEFGCRIERFKPGKDAGVDGRFFSDGEEVIIQFKHWLKSGVEALVRKLISDEKPKLLRLAPKRYIFVTSLALSRRNKAQIQAALSPYIQSESDIYGQEDLNDLLRRHPNVEQNNYKLWFGSVTVLTRLLNAKVVGRSQFRLEEARDFSSRYVVTSSHDAALTKLEEMGAIIITGEPGVGKSTLAEQLALVYVAKGFELCCIAASVEEGESLWRNEDKQLFYFDDFLGRNYLMALQRNEDSHIVNFLKRVSKDNRKRFILTSRTTVLNQGKSLTDLFRIANLEQKEFELRIDSLSLMDKGRILYSHVWNSLLDGTYIDQIYFEKRYAKIAKHRNFNPRLIGFITDYQKVGNIPPEKYGTYIEDTLSNPADVWAHVFNTQLNVSARLLVRLVVLNGSSISEQALLSAFHFYAKTPEIPAERADEFAGALQLTVGSVLNRSLGQMGESAMVTLFNPSLGDYVIRRYGLDTDELARCLSALRSQSSLRNLAALGSAMIVSATHRGDILSRLAKDFLLNGEIDFQYRLALASDCVRCDGNVRDLPEIVDFLRELVASDVSDRPDVQGWLVYQASNRGLVDSDSSDYLRKLEELIEASTDSDDLSALVAPLDQVPRDVAEPLSLRLTEVYVEVLKNAVGQSVIENDVIGDYRDEDDFSSAVEDVRSHVRKWAESDGIELSEYEINEIADEVDFAAALEANLSNWSDDEGGGWSRGGTSEGDDLDDLFDRS